MGDRGPLGNLEPETCHECGRIGEPGTMFVPEGSFVRDMCPMICEWWCKDREACESAIFGVPAYYIVFGSRRYKTFCNAPDAEKYLELGDEPAWDHTFSRHASIGLEPEPGRTYVFEGHEDCIDLDDDCPCQCHKNREAAEGQAYADAVNAPLSPAAIEALAEALRSGDVPRRRVWRRNDD